MHAPWVAGRVADLIDLSHGRCEPPLKGYRVRWTLEQAFNELITHLQCELNALGYPKAVLFAFCGTPSKGWLESLPYPA